MLRIEDLSVHYGRIKAVRDLTLRVDTGEIVALLGPNGAGKSTTLNAVAGALRAAAGRIRLDDVDVTGASAPRMVQRGVTLVPEGRRIFATLTVAENLAIGGTAQRDRRQLAADIDRQLERFPVLRRYYHSPADRLSGGEQQQLAVARALVARPRLLLLDEPSLGLAPKLVDVIFSTVEELRRDDGLTILIVEQNASRAVELADRCYVLRGGELIAEAGRGELQPDQLGALYLADREVL
jgi:branched-chain amino acid transport system ATP-binding protein